MNKNGQNDSTRHYITFLSRKYSAVSCQSLSRNNICNQVSLKSSAAPSFIAITEPDKKEIKTKPVT